MSTLLKTVPCFGAHLIVEFYEARNLVDPEPVEDVLKRAAKAADAVVLGANIHDFGDRAGVTGVVLLEESHISIHTWPECGYAAIDVFMCGEARPEACVDVMRAYFLPAREEITRLTRGVRTVAEPSLSRNGGKAGAA